MTETNTSPPAPPTKEVHDIAEIDARGTGPVRRIYLIEAESRARDLARICQGIAVGDFSFNVKGGSVAWSSNVSGLPRLREELEGKNGGRNFSLRDLLFKAENIAKYCSDQKVPDFSINLPEGSLSWKSRREIPKELLRKIPRK